MRNNNHDVKLVISPAVGWLLNTSTFQYKNIKPYVQDELLRYRRDFEVIVEHLKETGNYLEESLEDIKPSSVIWQKECGKSEVHWYRPISKEDFLVKIENIIANLKTILHTSLYLEEIEDFINNEFDYYYSIAVQFSESHWGRWRWYTCIESLFIVGIIRLNDMLLDLDIETRKELILEALKMDPVKTQISVIEINGEISRHVKRRIYKGFDILDHENYLFESFKDLEELVEKLAPLIKELGIDDIEEPSGEKPKSDASQISARTVCFIHFYLGIAKEGVPLTEGNLTKFEKTYGIKASTLKNWISKAKDENFRTGTTSGTGLGAMKECYKYCLHYFQQHNKQESYRLARKDFEEFQGNN